MVRFNGSNDSRQKRDGADRHEGEGWVSHRKADMIAVAVGAFADPAFPRPSQAVYEEFRHHWVSI